jgi:4-carboxymuconolactone decarboxylase
MRLPLIKPDDLTPEQRPLYDDMKAGIEAHFTGFVSMRQDGALIGPWNPTLHWPKFGKPWWDYTKALGTDPLLPKPVREVAILAVGARFKARYELYAHVAVGEKVGLAEDKIATIVAGQRPANLSREESVAYDVASALAAGGILPKATYNAAVETFGQDAAAELAYLVAGYCLVSVILNAFDVPVPEPDDSE